MRITGGKEKGRTIRTLKSSKVRPTSSKVRESLFNIIRDYLDNAVFLDLFAGSGIVGIEALSRGCKKAVFVDKSYEVTSLLKKNLSNFSFESEIICSDSLKAIKKFDKKTFDVIFVDPPYKSDIFAPVIIEISKEKILKPEGILVVEHSSRSNLTEGLANISFKLLKRKIYGDTTITIISLV